MRRQPPGSHPQPCPPLTEPDGVWRTFFVSWLKECPLVRWPRMCWLACMTFLLSFRDQRTLYGHPKPPVWRRPPPPRLRPESRATVRDRGLPPTAFPGPKASNLCHEHSSRRTSAQVWKEGAHLVIAIKDDGRGFDHGAATRPDSAPHVLKQKSPGVFLPPHSSNHGHLTWRIAMSSIHATSAVQIPQGLVTEISKSAHNSKDTRAKARANCR